MPGRPLRQCTYPGCYTLTRGRVARCERHPDVWVKSAVTVKRIRGTHLQRLRRQLFSRNPLCVECMKVGTVSLAEERDHIVPLEFGGTDTEENTQGLCKACHEAKSKAEGVVGSRRWAGKTGGVVEPSC